MKKYLVLTMYALTHQILPTNTQNIVANAPSRDALVDPKTILSARSAATADLDIEVQDTAGRWFATHDWDWNFQSLNFLGITRSLSLE